MINRGSKILVTGHKGLVGSAIVRALKKDSYRFVVTVDKNVVDLRNQAQTGFFIYENNFDAIFHVAGRVGGIKANSTYPAQFIYDNLMIAANVINSAYKHGVKKLLYVGSSCIYPKVNSSDAIKETDLLTGPLERTNEAYAIAKIAGIKMCQFYRDQYKCNFIAAMPTNCYGPNDTYDPDKGHVLPSLIYKVMSAKYFNSPSIEIWGTGTPHREFIHSDDLASGLIHLMKEYNERDIVNIGSPDYIQIKDLVKIICDEVGYSGEVVYNGKLDGVRFKRLDSTVIRRMGWKPLIPLTVGIRNVIAELEKEERYKNW